MSLSRIDARFLLPRRPASALVAGDLPGWTDGLDAAGIALTAASPDLAVGPASAIGDLIATGADLVVVEGAARARRLRDAGYHVRRYAALPAPEAPELFVPLDGSAAAYALDRLIVAPTRAKRLRNLAARALMPRGVFPPSRTVAVAQRAAGSPYPVAAARGAGVAEPRSVLLVCSSRAPGTRNVFLVFEPDATEPRWAVKFSRIPGDSEAVDLEAEATAELAGITAIEEHAPRSLGRVQADDLHCAVETATVGEQLAEFLRSARPQAVKREAIEMVAGWALDVARSTRSTAPHDLAWLEAELNAIWGAWGVDAELVRSMGAAPQVALHDDLAATNVIVDGDRFTVVDWENARRHGPPLWDLLFLLRDALGILETTGGADERVEHFARLFAGEGASSESVFAWTQRAVAELELPAAAVGPLATTCWLHHGVDDGPQPRGPGGAVTMKTAMARRWLEDPALGWGWDRWRR